MIRIFISHSSKNGKLVLKFADFLEKVSSEIEVFCSSEKGSIQIGENFIKTIFRELDSCDVFVPIISREYYESKFCMVELGVAYSYLYNRYNEKGQEYIFPFALYPVKKSQALSGTPLADIQAGDLNNEQDLHGFLEYLAEEKGINYGAGLNRKIHSFKFETDCAHMRNQNLVKLARTKVCFDDNIEFRNREDIVGLSVAGNAMVVNFNLNPYGKTEVKYPNFISLVLQYVDNLDLSRYLDVNDKAEFHFVISNFTNSVKRIFVEFKHSDSLRILETFSFSVEQGECYFSIPLEQMRSDALNNISEICFVIHPDDVTEEEGMFKIGEIEVN